MANYDQPDNPMQQALDHVRSNPEHYASLLNSLVARVFSGETIENTIPSINGYLLEPEDIIIYLRPDTCSDILYNIHKDMALSDGVIEVRTDDDIYDPMPFGLDKFLAQNPEEGRSLNSTTSAVIALRIVRDISVKVIY